MSFANMKEVVFFLVIVLFPQSIQSSAEQFNGLTIDLIHIDSPLSPFYNSSITQSEVILNAAMRSISRKNRFHMIPAYRGIKAHETVMIPNKGDYLMKIFIGTPPVESIALADTGSGLIWVQCLPCQECFKQQAPIFDPEHSPTYEEISCSSASCILWDNHACGFRDQCRYFQKYADQSYSEGELAKDIISFGHSVFSTPKTIFGCGHVNGGLFDGKGTGIVGLGSGPLSLVSQLGPEIGYIFSYCLLPYTVNSTSKLKIGSTSTMPGNKVTTPLVSKSYYYLTLDDVSIEDLKIQGTSESIQIVIDSGATLTFLETNLYNSIETAVAKVVEIPSLQFPPKPFKLCYWLGNIEIYPDITFHFLGADIHLEKENIFLTVGPYSCLAMIPTNGISIFGSISQINFKVEYDLLRKTVSFAHTDCTKE